MNWESARDQLRQARNTGSRESEKTLRLGKVVLAESPSKLGDELWTVYEQLFIAAIDCGHHLEAETFLVKLETKFPDSVRVKRLRGMKMESEERYEDASKLYDLLLEKDEPNAPIRKRKIAILITERKRADAIKELTEYLESFMSDQEAWLQLSDLHLQQMDYKHAAFCVEELLLSDPQNYLFHQHYAEMLYTMGGVENVDMARKHFAQALKLNPNSMRALYGFHLTCISLPKKKDRDTDKWAGWAELQILEKYKAANQDDKVALIGEMLRSMKQS